MSKQTKQTDSKDNKIELQRMYVELRLLEQQSSQIHQQLSILDNQLSVLERTKESIDDLKNSNKESSVFVPIGQGVFAKGKLEDTSSLLVSVGANILVKKSIPESKEVVDTQISEVKNLYSQLESHLQQLSAQGMMLQQAIASQDPEMNQ